MAIHLDANEGRNIGDYACYDLILWGRYEYCEHIGVHVGFFAQAGMKMDRVYPIVGFDWKLSNRWKLNLVYPVNISLEYLLSKHWTIALAERNFNVRYRVRHRESHPKFLVRYENKGAELAIKYEDNLTTANVHAGYTFGGLFKVANYNNHHPHHYRLDSAGYIGAEATIKF